MKVDACWITVNRSCNLRCKWCYAKSSQYLHDDMSLERFRILVDIAIDVGVKQVLLIGGEPTIHNDFLGFLDYLKNRGVRTTVVSNGLMLDMEEFCKKLIPFKDNINIDISLKGSSDEQYQLNTGSNCFNKVVRAINNANRFNIRHSLSYVVSDENVNNLPMFFNEIRASGIKEGIGFGLCNPSIRCDGGFDDNNNGHTLIEVARKFALVYDLIKDEQFGLLNNAPLCLQQQCFIKELLDKHKMSTGCHVLSRNGLIFDTKGELLFCNSLVGFPFGKYGEDFVDAESLRRYWDSEKVLKLYQQLTRLPSEKCFQCDMKEYCAGGCCFQYFKHSFKELENL